MQNVDFKTALRDRGLKLSHVAASLNVNKSQVSRWLQGGVPAERVLAFEQASGISRHDLRPDLYPRDNVQAAE